MLNALIAIKYTKNEKISNLMNIKFEIEPVYGNNGIYKKIEDKSKVIWR